MFISKKEHLRLMALKDAEIKRLEDKVQSFGLMEKLYDKHTSMYADVCINGSGSMSYGNIVNSLPDSVAKLVDDHFGGKSFKHEATTSVTILDEEGKATYAVTRQPPDKGRKYRLVQK